MARGRIPATALILAGGESSRMGQRKEFMEFGGVRLIEHAVRLGRGMFEDALIVAPEPAAFEGLGLRVARDAGERGGPLGGICGGLEEMGGEYGFAFACDMPFLMRDLVELLWGLREGADVVIPRWERGLEPLHAFYAKSCAEPARRALDAGKRRIVAFFEEVRVREVGPDELSKVPGYELSFMNVNTREEYKRAVRILNGRRGADRRRG